MDVKTYQELSSRTLNDGLAIATPKQMQLCNYALGLVGEAGELLDSVELANQAVRLEEPFTSVVTKELGDVLWYVSAIYTVLGLTMEEPSEGLLPGGYSVSYAQNLTMSACEVAEAIKKSVFHGVHNDALGVSLAGVLMYVQGLCEALGITLGEVMAVNVEKLKARYPDGFELGGGVRDG